MEKTQRLTGTNKANRALKIAVECCRVLIGVVFIFSGFVKAVERVWLGGIATVQRGDVVQSLCH